MSMKKSLAAAAVYTVLIAFAGCASNAQFLQAASHSRRHDVFREVAERESVPRGYADLELEASIKTHTEGYYPFEPKASPHGKPGYSFLVNVDGQAAKWEVDGVIETTPPYRAGRAKDPEGGTGMRYVLRKSLRVTAGRHRIFFALPGERRYREFDITLEEGQSYVLRFSPVYMPVSFYSFEPCFRRTLADRQRHFTGGLARLDCAIAEAPVPLERWLRAR